MDWSEKEEAEFVAIAEACMVQCSQRPEWHTDTCSDAKRALDAAVALGARIAALETQLDAANKRAFDREQEIIAASAREASEYRDLVKRVHAAEAERDTALKRAEEAEERCRLLAEAGQRLSAMVDKYVGAPLTDIDPRTFGDVEPPSPNTR